MSEYDKRYSQVGDKLEVTYSVSESDVNEILDRVWEDYGENDNYYDVYSVYRMLQNVGVKNDLASSMYQELHSEVTESVSKEGSGGPRDLSPEKKMEALACGNLEELLDYGVCCCHGAESVAEYLSEHCSESEGKVDIHEVWERVEEALEEYIGDTPPKDVTKDSIIHTAKLAAGTVTVASSR